MYNAATPLFELAALYFLLRALRTHSPLNYGLAGIAIGLGLCFYSAFLPFLAVLALFVGWIAWRERKAWRQIAQGVTLVLVLAALVIAPVVKFAATKPDLYFARVRNTSIFAGKAPVERLPAVMENARKHLLMFNVWGDPNGRHNLPGAPMLDTVTAGLLVLGLALCLRRIKRPEMALLPIWVLVGLAGGIFSLDFEAPQSLRSIGALPAIYLMAALPVGEVAQEWVSGAGRYYPGLAVWGQLAVIIPAALLNVSGYFGRQTGDFATWNAHSTPETMTARILKELAPGVQAHVISLYDHHPTVRFLADGVSYRRLETNASLPLLEPAENDIVLIFDQERQKLFAEAQRLYPTGMFEEVRPPFGGPVILYVARLTQADLQAIQGLQGAYTPTAGSAQFRRDAVVDFVWPQDAPVATPFVAEWEGMLAVNTYGPHQFFVQAPGEVALTVGGEPVLEGDASQAGGLTAGVVLARGNHSVHLRADGKAGQISLGWRTPDRGPEVIPPWALYSAPVRGNGLLGQYFANGDWQPPVAFAQIDPQLGIYFHVPVLPRPYTVSWTGTLAVPEAGRYGFGLESIDESVLLIDGVEVVAGQLRDTLATGEIELAEGNHAIEVRYADRTDHTHINLLWRPPLAGVDSGYQLLPSEYLFPPQADLTKVTVPPLTSLLSPQAYASQSSASAPLSPASVEVMLDQLAAPRGVAVTSDSVYVAETGAQQVLALSLVDGSVALLPPGAEGWTEPLDLAVGPGGELVVLDGEGANLSWYHPDGEFATYVAAETALLERARGVEVDASGRIWIAGTPSQRIVAVDTAGVVLTELVRPAVTGDTQEMQPVDVASQPDGSVYVTDAGNHRLYLFDSSGLLVATWEMPVANSLDGAHLATDGKGNLFVTEPETGRVVKYGPAGAVLAVYSARSAATPDAKPVGIDVDETGAIWVADVDGGRVLRLQPVE
jgi:streptogramin lyase